MLDMQKLKDMIEKHEGKRNKPYKCSAGKTTIGIGRNLDDKGLTDHEIQMLFSNDVTEALMDVESILPSKFKGLPENIKFVLVDMRFNLGPKGFRKFKNMLNAVKYGNWKEMKVQMINSKWYEQVGRRGKNLVKLVDMEIGTFDKDEGYVEQKEEE